MEEVVGAEGVVASNRPVAVTGADGDGEIVAAFGMVGAGAIATPSVVVIDGGPEAVRLTGEGRGRCSVWVPVRPVGGLSGAPLRHPRRACSISNCDILGFLLINSGIDLGFPVSYGIEGLVSELGTRRSVLEPALSSSCSKY